MRRLLLAALCSFVMVAGCAWLGLQKPPSVCDDMAPGESVLCDLAGAYDLHLETVGDLFLVVNLRAIKQGAYTAQDAIDFFERAKVFAQAEVSPMDLRMLVLAYVQDFPELLLLSPYLAYMDTPEPITGADKKMLGWWVDYNLRLLQ